MAGVTLYNPVDFTPIEVTVPAEEVRLRAAGYRDTKPFDPADHNLAEVQEHLAKHPEDANRVLTLEASGRRRKTLLGDAADQEPSGGEVVDGSNAGGEGETPQDGAADGNADGSGVAEDEPAT